MTESFLRLPKVKQRTGFGRSQIYLLIKQGKFPKQIHIGSKSVAWLDSEVSEWMKERIRLSRNGLQPNSPPLQTGNQLKNRPSIRPGIVSKDKSKTRFRTLLRHSPKSRRIAPTPLESLVKDLDIEACSMKAKPIQKEKND